LHGVFGLAANAQSLNIDATLNESVVMVPKQGVFTIALETTLYKPDGEGPFPVVILNHGKAYGDPRFQDRYRPALAARYFLHRGYAVVVPMRQGFSKSEGRYIGVGCNIESNGEIQADDVQAALDYVGTQPWADKSRVLIAGQSHGGWTTLATGARNIAGVKGLVNFAGGLRNDDCPGWQNTLARGAAAFAKTTTVPSIWFYGDNDSFFNTPTYRQMYEQYIAAGGRAKLVAYGNFGTDSHAMFGSAAGTGIWQPELDRFLASVGMPSEPLEAYAKFGRPSYTPVPPKTLFAALNDETKVPYVRDSGRAGFKKYLTLPLPRAFAIAPSGAWGWSYEGDDPLKRALELCANFAKAACTLYSVDENIVWPVEPAAQ
jgi:dienelactone hydrolase